MDRLDGLQDLAAVEGEVHAVRDVDAHSGFQSRIENPDGRGSPDVEAAAAVLWRNSLRCFKWESIVCSAAVVHTTCNQQGVGFNPVEWLAFFFSFYRLSRVSLKRTLLSFL